MYAMQTTFAKTTVHVNLMLWNCIEPIQSILVCTKRFAYFAGKIRLKWVRHAFNAHIGFE